MTASVRRRPFSVPAVLATLLAAGCAGGPAVTRPSIAVRSALHRVAVTVRVEPSADPGRAPPAGVLEGMGEGAVSPFRRAAEGLSSVDTGPVTGEGLAFVVALGAAVTVAASLGGTVYGAFATNPEADVQRWSADFHEQRTAAGTDLGLAEALRRAVAESGTQAEPCDGSDADATLDVVLREPVIVCDGVFSPTAVLRFAAEASLRPAGAASVPLGRFDFVSGKRPSMEWTDAPSPIAAELRLGARQVADAIVDYALRLETKDGR